MIKNLWESVSSFIVDIFRKRRMIAEMTKADFKTKYMDSVLGIFWAFFQPIVFIFVIYFIFELGIRGGRGSDSDVPFVAYLVTGMAAYNFLSMSFTSGANVILSYSYLLNRPDFRISIIPIVKVLSILLVHLIFLLLVVGLYFVNDIQPTWYWLYLPYYMICAVLLVLGATWITSSITPFIPDLSKFIPILTQLGFWFTPIFWDIERLPSDYHFFIKLNPAFYIVSGYRNSLLYGTGIGEMGWLHYYFWGITIFMLVAGMLTYKRLRPHFAEAI